ncbi:Uncharacterised protein g11293 [Pycnogonum litorale]
MKIFSLLGIILLSFACLPGFASGDTCGDDHMENCLSVLWEADHTMKYKYLYTNDDRCRRMMKYLDCYDEYPCESSDKYHPYKFIKWEYEEYIGTKCRNVDFNSNKANVNFMLIYSIHISLFLIFIL